MEGGQTAVRLARAEVDRPWGKPGIDFDQAYSVTITPLYPRPAAADAGVREDLVELATEEIARHLEIDWDGDEPFIRNDSIEAAARAALSLAAKREQAE
jgi:hypothetical protein